MPTFISSTSMSAINKKHKVNFIFVDTDYEYHPFTDEVLADYYVIPKGLEDKFVSRGIDNDKLLPLGVPISSKYINSAKNIKDKLLIDKKMVLILLGSTGFGNVEDILSELLTISNIYVVIVCGNNKKLYNSLRKYDNSNLTVFGYSKNINDLIKSSDIVISKPGGLSSTEVAVFRKALIHAFPIPGVETSNTEFFSKLDLSLVAHSNEDIIKYLNLLLNDNSLCNKMIDSQKKHISVSSAKDLVNFIKDKYM